MFVQSHIHSVDIYKYFFLPDFLVALLIRRSPLEMPVMVTAFSEIMKKATASSIGVLDSLLKALPLPDGVSNDPEA